MLTYRRSWIPCGHWDCNYRNPALVAIIVKHGPLKQHCGNHQYEDSEDTTNVRFQLLPRLAESLATKVLQGYGASSTVADCLLLLKCLQVQSKWQKTRTMLSNDDDDNNLLVKLPSTQRLAWTAWLANRTNNGNRTRSWGSHC